jgi:[ribosomal protein S5]-alanine N-acetyltransferase
MMQMPYPYSLQMARDYIKKSKGALNKKNPNEYNLLIELKSEKKIIGGIGLADIDYFRKIAGIGYWLNEKYHKQGIMSEAVGTVLNFAFNKLAFRIKFNCL